MTKLLKYLLPLCILLSGGISQLAGQAIEQTASHFAEQNVSVAAANETTVRAYNHGESSKSYPISIEEKEEDETETSQKNLLGNGNSVSHNNHNFLFGVQKHLILSKYTTYLPSYKSICVLFQVFRI